MSGEHRTKLDEDIERGCQAIYREREGYWPSESERARIAIAVKEVTATHTGEAWVECSCGKVYRVFHRETSQELVDLMLRVSKMGTCKTCSAEMQRKLDMCTESTERGGCKLGWAHKGHCEPYPEPPRFVRLAAHLNPGKSVPVPAEDDDPICRCGHPYSQHATEGLHCESCGCEHLDFRSSVSVKE